MSARQRRLAWLLAGGALALLAGRWLAGVYADWAFFSALDLTEVWRSRVLHTGGLAATAFVLVSLFALANLLAVRQSIISLVLPRRLLNLEIPEAVPTVRLTILAVLLALAIGAGFALIPHDWSAAALAWDRVAFREFEPFLERDLGFYVTWLPWERALQARTTMAFVVVGALVVAMYAATPSVRWNEAGFYVSTWVRRHLSLLGGLGVLLVGWDWRLDRYERLITGSGIIGDAGWDTAFAAYDHRIAVPYLAALSFASIPVAAVLVWAGWHGYRRLAFTLLSALILGGPVAGALLPLLARDSLTTSAGRELERSYLNTGALFTRRAFGVEDVALGDSVPRATLSTAEMATHVSVWDPAALVQYVRTARRDAPMVLTAWRGSPSGLEALALDERVVTDSAADPRRLDRFSASRTDARGSVLPLLGVVPERIEGVLLEPGASRYVLLPDPGGRVAAPSFSTALERMALAWALQTPSLVLHASPSPRPKLVTHRDVRERLALLTPFFTVGPTVTPVIRGDSLHWIAELFTTSSYYPLSEALPVLGREVHMARHAATAIVQAQTGRVILVPAEHPDAVARSWMSRYPRLFTSMAGAPIWFRAQRPPAIDVTLVQGAALSRVGFANDTLGRRSVSRADGADVDLAVGPATLVQLDSAGALGWSVAMDVPWSGRTLGLLVARGGTHRRTEYHEAAGPRWTTVLEELQRAGEDAGFGRGIPDARRGRVQVIPTRTGPAYVQSFYEWPQSGAPRFMGVAISTNGEVRAGRTLAEALGLRTQSAQAAIPSDVFRARVSALYDAMQSALRAGDWRAYGDAWAALGALLGRTR